MSIWSWPLWWPSQHAVQFQWAGCIEFCIISFPAWQYGTVMVLHACQNFDVSKHLRLWIIMWCAAHYIGVGHTADCVPRSGYVESYQRVSFGLPAWLSQTSHGTDNAGTPGAVIGTYPACCQCRFFLGASMYDTEFCIRQCCAGLSTMDEMHTPWLQMDHVWCIVITTGQNQSSSACTYGACCMHVEIDKTLSQA